MCATVNVRESRGRVCTTWFMLHSEDQGTHFTHLRTYNGRVDRKFTAAQGLLAEVKPGFKLR